MTTNSLFKAFKRLNKQSETSELDSEPTLAEQDHRQYQLAEFRPRTTTINYSFKSADLSTNADH